MKISKRSSIKGSDIGLNEFMKKPHNQYDRYVNKHMLYCILTNHTTKYISKVVLSWCGRALTNQLTPLTSSLNHRVKIKIRYTINGEINLTSNLVLIKLSLILHWRTMDKI